jgi:hypothetical protein
VRYIPDAYNGYQCYRTILSFWRLLSFPTMALLASGQTDGHTCSPRPTSHGIYAPPKPTRCLRFAQFLEPPPSTIASGSHCNMCNTQSTFETSRCNTCNIRLKTDTILGKHLKTHENHCKHTQHPDKTLATYV